MYFYSLPPPPPRFLIIWILTFLKYEFFFHSHNDFICVLFINFTYLTTLCKLWLVIIQDGFISNFPLGKFLKLTMYIYISSISILYLIKLFACSVQLNFIFTQISFFIVAWNLLYKFAFLLLLVITKVLFFSLKEIKAAALRTLTSIIHLDRNPKWV